MTTIFDCETLPLPPAEILKIRGEFNRDSLKPPGNISKAETIDRWYADQEATWLTPPEAGLKPIWSQIAIAGFAHTGTSSKIYVGQLRLDDSNEKALIAEAWKNINAADLVLGYSLEFDISMLIARSVICGIPVPRGVRKGRWLAPKFQCIMQAIHGSEYVSLETTLRACGLESKTSDGSKFAELWEKDRTAALAYNENDCLLEHMLAQRVGLI